MVLASIKQLRKYSSDTIIHVLKRGAGAEDVGEVSVPGRPHRVLIRPHQSAQCGGELRVAFIDREIPSGALVLWLRGQGRLCQVGKAGEGHSRQDTVSPKAVWYEARMLIQEALQSPAWLKPRGKRGAGKEV